MSKPIFLLGKHRSGTTWLANQLCQHSLIAGVTHERHHGIHESAYFSCVHNRYGDLSTKSNFVEFVEVISASDYFRLAGATKEFLYSLWPTTYEGVFRAVMDNYAISQGAKYWIEKSPAHSVLVDRLATIYPDAKFISVVRDVEAVVASTIARSRDDNANRQLRLRHIISTVLSWTFYNKTLNSFAARTDRMLIVRYEALQADLASSLRQICSFLELHFESSMREHVFVPNSSFRKRESRQTLSDRERILVRLIKHLFELIPLKVFKLASWRMTIKMRRSLPPWFFKMYSFYAGIRQPVEDVNHQK